jgi:hypothetical protein
MGAWHKIRKKISTEYFKANNATSKTEIEPNHRTSNRQTGRKLAARYGTVPTYVI